MKRRKKEKKVVRLEQEINVVTSEEKVVKSAKL